MSLFHVTFSFHISVIFTCLLTLFLRALVDHNIAVIVFSIYCSNCKLPTTIPETCSLSRRHFVVGDDEGNRQLSPGRRYFN